ncbi:unnamed protein product [Heterobilharzia americana]|nr:unnamed protein product [Heterobilharzia americana]
MSKRNISKMSYRQVCDRTAALAAQLMELCLSSKITPCNAIESLEAFHSLTSEIMAIQEEYSFVSKLESRGSRKACLEVTLSSVGGYASDMCAVHWFKEFGFGLRALVPIEEGDQLITVPRRAVCCLENSSKNLREFISQDSLASNMENVALCLCLLGELYEGDNSPWQDYIKSLPSDYSIFLYMSVADIRHLKGSPTLEKVATNYLFICRQYAYFCCQFMKNPKIVNVPNFVFCFKDYRWAVSTVMSRSNYIPHSNGRDKIMCLIPVWDMINHKFGHVTTHYDPEMDELVFNTMEAYEPGDQIFMDYGKRTNEEFFLFSGFVPDYNPHNKLTITLGLSSSDSLGLLRRQLLQTLSLNVPLKCDLRSDKKSMTEFFIFSRIFSMDEGELNNQLMEANSDCQAVKLKLSEFKFTKEKSSDYKAFTFMINRLKLLIAAYGSVVLEGDPEWTQLSSVQQNCERLKYHETAILRSSIRYVQRIMDDSDENNICGYDVFIRTNTNSNTDNV